MGTIFSNLLSGASSIFGGVWGYIGIGVVALAVGGYGGYRFELGTYEARVVADAQAQVTAISLARDALAKSDAITLHSAVAEAAAQQRIVTRTVTITQEIPRYVTTKQDTSSCISYGLIRLLDATVLSADPATLPLPGGQSNDACAPVKASALASSIIANYGAAKANAEQLDALEAWIKAQTTL